MNKQLRLDNQIPQVHIVKNKEIDYTVDAILHSIYKPVTIG